MPTTHLQVMGMTCVTGRGGSTYDVPPPGPGSVTPSRRRGRTQGRPGGLRRWPPARPGHRHHPEGHDTAGHSYGVTARYDNSRPWDDVMGINLTYVWWSNQKDHSTSDQSAVAASCGASRRRPGTGYLGSDVRTMRRPRRSARSRWSDRPAPQGIEGVGARMDSHGLARTLAHLVEARGQSRRPHAGTRPWLGHRHAPGGWLTGRTSSPWSGSFPGPQRRSSSCSRSLVVTG